LVSEPQWEKKYSSGMRLNLIWRWNLNVITLVFIDLNTHQVFQPKQSHIKSFNQNSHTSSLQPKQSHIKSFNQNSHTSSLSTKTVTHQVFQPKQSHIKSFNQNSHTSSLSTKTVTHQVFQPKQSHIKSFNQNSHTSSLSTKTGHTSSLQPKLVTHQDFNQNWWANLRVQRKCEQDCQFPRRSNGSSCRSNQLRRIQNRSHQGAYSPSRDNWKTHLTVSNRYCWHRLINITRKVGNGLLQLENATALHFYRIWFFCKCGWNSII